MALHLNSSARMQDVLLHAAGTPATYFIFIIMQVQLGPSKAECLQEDGVVHGRFP